MARPPQGSPIEGGYFVTGAKKLLADEKLRASGLTGQLWYCLAVMQLVCPFEGRYEHAGMPYPADMIVQRAGITMDEFKRLVELGFIQRDANGVYFISKWMEYQSPQTKATAKARKKKLTTNEPLNESLNYELNESRTYVESLILNPKSLIKNPERPKPNDNGSVKPKDFFKKKALERKRQDFEALASLGFPDVPFPSPTKLQAAEYAKERKQRAKLLQQLKDHPDSTKL